jgi:signal transduction histidine kinase
VTGTSWDLAGAPAFGGLLYGVCARRGGSVDVGPEHARLARAGAVDGGAPAPEGRYVPERRPRPDALGALQSISGALAGQLELEEVLSSALRVVTGVADAEAGSVLLVDPDSGEMRFYAAAGPATAKLKTIPLPPGEGICGYVARTGEPLIVNDAQNDPRLYRRVDEVTAGTTRDLLCVPIRSSQRTWGVLELMNKHPPGTFDATDLRLAEVLAAETALALDNARLHAEVVRKERMAAVGQTVSGLAHCIKNILNGVRSGSAVIQRAIEAEDLQRVHHGWRTVHRNNRMLEALVLDMLSLARDAKPRPFATDVNDLAEQVCTLMRQRAADGGAEIVFDPCAALEEVLVDPAHLYRSLLNLVSNAVDACGDGGRVRVRVGAGRDGRVTLSVADTGEGIAPELARKLFRDFVTTKGGRGTGLGLPVTKKLVTEMDGTIKFHSVPGRGTRFVIAVPATPPTAQGKETPS